jgi:hypothetical protein
MSISTGDPLLRMTYNSLSGRREWEFVRLAKREFEIEPVPR